MTVDVKAELNAPEATAILVTTQLEIVTLNGIVNEILEYEARVATSPN